MRAVMQASELWKLYASGESTVQAVKGVNVSIGEGEMIAIMGPSGCGKTTLLNVLSGIDEPTSGTVTIDDKSLFTASDNERSKMRAEYLGFIFQDFNLLPVLSAVENFELPLLLLGKSAGEARSTALDALSAVGLGDRSEHRPSELSGGQQQYNNSLNKQVYSSSLPRISLTISPSSMCRILLHCAATSLSWVTNKNVVPIFSLMLFSKVMTLAEVAESRLPVGSSHNITEGL